MGIERQQIYYPVTDSDNFACKKSPQTWGLKVFALASKKLLSNLTCKKSPQTWGLKDLVG